MYKALNTEVVPLTRRLVKHLRALPDVPAQFHHHRKPRDKPWLKGAKGDDDRIIRRQRWFIGKLRHRRKYTPVWGTVWVREAGKLFRLNDNNLDAFAMLSNKNFPRNSRAIVQRYVCDTYEDLEALSLFLEDPRSNGGGNGKPKAR